VLYFFHMRLIAVSETAKTILHDSADRARFMNIREHDRQAEGNTPPTRNPERDPQRIEGGHLRLATDSEPGLADSQLSLMNRSSRLADGAGRRSSSAAGLERLCSARSFQPAHELTRALSSRPGSTVARALRQLMNISWNAAAGLPARATW